ncbi:MAG: CBS domain-containing protein [Bacteroidota bacterium]
MIAEFLISDEILPLRKSDTGEEALGIMNDFYLRHLPLVEDGQLLAIISDEFLLDVDPMAEISSYPLPPQPIFVRRSDHLYDVMRISADQQLTIIPVLDDEGNYCGLITIEKLLRHFVESGSFKEPGSIVILEMGRHDYSLAEIARIVEGEGAIILSSFLQSHPDSNRIEVTLKLNGRQIGNIIATLERFSYSVTPLH